VRGLFSTFPGGRSAVALLLLRLIVGVSASGQGILYLSQPPTWASFVGAALLIPCGLCVLVGLATPVASLVVAFGILAISTSWLALPTERLLDCRPALFELIAISLSIALMGPGSLSLDARLFGRREILIPPSSRPKQS
jgi:uncharacterized membrane protein YphA (DoxX/SURF4 family)